MIILSKKQILMLHSQLIEATDILKWIIAHQK